LTSQDLNALANSEVIMVFKLNPDKGPFKNGEKTQAVWYEKYEIH
jgi:hypothetical protein